MAADEIRLLYGVPPKRFTAERNALAGRLREAGKREAAAEVAALRRTPLSAWAVNQFVRERTPLLRDLLKAADRLRKAHGGKLDFQAADGDARRSVEQGVLDQDLEPPGFEALE